MSITPFKDRELANHARVQVYLNLHKRADDGTPWYSIRHRGRVVAHADQLVLRNVRFHVDAAGRDRVREQNRKNVHAFIEGDVCLDIAPNGEGMQLFYDPYRVDEFVVAGTDRVVRTADVVNIAGAMVQAA